MRTISYAPLFSYTNCSSNTPILTFVLVQNSCVSMEISNFCLIRYMCWKEKKIILYSFLSRTFFLSLFSDDSSHSKYWFPIWDYIPWSIKRNSEIFILRPLSFVLFWHDYVGEINSLSNSVITIILPSFFCHETQSRRFQGPHVPELLFSALLKSSWENFEYSTTVVLKLKYIKWNSVMIL